MLGRYFLILQITPSYANFSKNSKFPNNAMSSYTENDLLFVPVDFNTFRLISSFWLISREKPDVYKETSG